MHAPLRVFFLFMLLLFGACGEAGTACQDSCQLAQSCAGVEGAGTAAWFGWSCPATGACGAQAACQAQCITAASCDALANADPAGVSQLRSCMLACSSAGAAPVKDDTPQPVSSCVPNCAGRSCGSDGCGGSCGSCKKAYLKCDMASGSCQPDTPAYCFPHNECDYDGQIVCTKADRYRKCYKTYKGCLYLDCET